jgi:hypothetical protein
MFFRQFIFILLFSAVFVCTAHAKDLTIDQLRQACIADNTQDQKNCEAYLRGVGERLQTQKIYFNKSCRKTPVSAEDIHTFNDFIAKDNIKSELPANIYVFKYWSRDEGKIPCLETKGFWSVQDLQEICAQDYSGASPCKFYIESLTEFAKMQFTLAEQTFVCPGGSVQKSPYIIGDEEILGHYAKWVKKNPELKIAPAALGFIDAMVLAYPCPE